MAHDFLNVGFVCYSKNRSRGEGDICRVPLHEVLYGTAVGAEGGINWGKAWLVQLDLSWLHWLGKW